MPVLRFAPSWRTTRWFNTPAPVSLDSLRGRVVFAIAFQMLCPGCVSVGLPQARRVRQTFSSDDVAVIGLHSVFEHHEAMTPTSLAAFLHEYRIDFPVGVDEPPGDAGLPMTMRAYGMQGTPTTLLIDPAGRLRLHKFGHETDLRLGASIMALIGDGGVEAKQSETGVMSDTCGLGGCEQS